MVQGALLSQQYKRTFHVHGLFSSFAAANKEGNVHVTKDKHGNLLVTFYLVLFQFLTALLRLSPSSKSQRNIVDKRQIEHTKRFKSDVSSLHVHQAVTVNSDSCGGRGSGTGLDFCKQAEEAVRPFQLLTGMGNVALLHRQ